MASSSNNTRLTHIPAFYRVWFSTIDPIVCFSTVVVFLLSPDQAMAAFIPPEILARNPLHDFFLHYIVALFFMLAVILVLMLRHAPHDLTVWRILQGAILSVDFAILASFAFSMQQQGREDYRLWRGEDWMTVIVTIWVALLRSAFLCGVGIKKGKGVKRA